MGAVQGPAKTAELMSEDQAKDILLQTAAQCAHELVEECIRQEGREAALHEIQLSRGTCLTRLSNSNEVILRHSKPCMAENCYEQLKMAIAEAGLLASVGRSA